MVVAQYLPDCYCYILAITNYLLPAVIVNNTSILGDYWLCMLTIL